MRQGLNIDQSHFYSLNFPTTALDQIPMTKLVGEISAVFSDFEPDELFCLILVMCIVIIVSLLMLQVLVQSGFVTQASSES